MKLVIFALMGLLLFSCGGESDTNVDVDVDSDTVVIEDDVAVEEVIEEEIEPVIEEEEEITEVTYSTVEDYGQIVSKEQLVSEFGEENLVNGESWFAEGTVKIEHTLLTNPENGQVINYLWEEDGNTLSFIEANYYLMDEDYSIYATQEIPSESGLRSGMPLDELLEWNGQDFSFYGFGWDYEGGIFADSSSRFADCPVQVKLSFDLEIEIPDAYRGMYSDGIFNTSDDIAQGAPVLLHILTYWP